MSDSKCADLIREKQAERNIHLENLNDIIGDNEADGYDVDNALEELANLALAIDSYKVVKITLSTGGPADWIEVKLDSDNSITGMTYHYADWFDHASERIYKNEYLWSYAEEIVTSGCY
jgi:hypothetical protein